MTRLITLTLVALLSISSIATAQTRTAPQPGLVVKTSANGNLVVAGNGMTLAQIIEGVFKELNRSGGGYTLVFQDRPMDVIPVDYDDPPVEVIANLQTSLQDVGYTWAISGKTITVKLAQTSAVAPASPSQAGSVNSGRRAAVEDLINRFPQAHEADGTIGSFEQARLLQEEVHSRYSQYWAPSAANEGRGYPNSGFGFFADSGYGFGGHAYMQRMIDLDTWGALRFKKGRERFMTNVEIYGCNQRVAQADEGNNIWDQKVLVPINCRPLTFRYSDGEVNWEIEIDELIVPLRLQSSKNITLNDAFFSKARKRTQFLNYDLIEQPDGSFLRVPR